MQEVVDGSNVDFEESAVDLKILEEMKLVCAAAWEPQLLGVCRSCIPLHPSHSIFELCTLQRSSISIVSCAFLLRAMAYGDGLLSTSAAPSLFGGSVANESGVGGP